MTREVRLTPDAAWDLIRLAAFLADRSPRTADRARETIKAAIRSLDEFAQRGRPVATGRELVVPFGRYAYVIVYRVDQDAVVIARIFHSHEHRK